MDYLLLFVAVLLALIYGIWFSLAGASWQKSFVKTVCILSLALVAWLWDGPAVLIVGLLFGALGDFWLSRDGDSAFLAGLVSFAVGHLAYVLLLWQFGALFQASVWTAMMAGFALGMAVFLWPHAGALRLPVLGYIGIIAAMGALALGLPEAHLWGAVAALVFIVSDTILANEVFVIKAGAPIRRFTSRAVWTSYFTAQLLFLLSFAGQMPL